ncbi:glycosyltransferase family 2 protein [Geodermatophilus sp. YIM 151500]|uniref:glycosyltransferase family 2 protein n=1 Tax=Geodermatophilus sp. YIM 151500 TaxID=2984531 RepID=UPI0021E46D13|nr:glycosyltransferase family 2 protein [Geodermatophilus sp. YIM 151500]MCV2488165.1 glycosyltransferase family 2 protein [Geodermatophilus sp. YIM 151500]
MTAAAGRAGGPDRDGGTDGDGGGPAPARVAVLVPVHDQAAFLPRALGSLLDQTVTDWEAVVLDDGSPDPDAVAAVLAGLPDARLRATGWRANRGLGATLNTGLDATTAPVVAYLPADDVWAPDHLAALLARLADPAVPIACSELDEPSGTGYAQLVQVAHRRTADRWTERAELETDDLDRLFWHRLRRGAPAAGTDAPAAGTGRVTCTWTRHPGQRSRAIRSAFDGGLNVFRSRYRVREPLRLASTDGADVDEVARYARFRHRPYRPSPDGLSVLVVGELAFNPERVLALAERGHRLTGLWTRDGLGDSTVGPLPFGHVADLPGADAPDGDWRAEVRALRPDVVWAQLNWRAVPLAHAVRNACPDLPFVWHFKEAPQRCIVRGEWPLLADLVTGADACLLATDEERDWFAAALPGRVEPARLGVLDGDLPLREWQRGTPRPKLSDADGCPHAVVAGRPSGLDAGWLVALARRGVHTHLYGQVRAPGPAAGWAAELDRARAAAPGFVHLHPPVGPERWVEELSRYDAGWLHRFTSRNGGDLRRAGWDDLNSPARLPVLLSAGLPALQQANPGALVAVERLLRADGTGLFYRSADEVADVLAAEVAGRRGAAAALAVRERHTFDAHADRLVELFRSLAR